MKRQIVRVHSKDDTVCLSFDESKRVHEHLALCELDEHSLEQEISDTARTVLLGDSLRSGCRTSVDTCTRILEKCLYARAETFACAVVNGKVSDIALDHLNQIIIDDISSLPPKKVIGRAIRMCSQNAS